MVPSDDPTDPSVPVFSPEDEDDWFMAGDSGAVTKKVGDVDPHGTDNVDLTPEPVAGPDPDVAADDEGTRVDIPVMLDADDLVEIGSDADTDGGTDPYGTQVFSTGLSESEGGDLPSIIVEEDEAQASPDEAITREDIPVVEPLAEEPEDGILPGPMLRAVPSDFARPNDTDETGS